jgi:hypothetical protein
MPFSNRELGLLELTLTPLNPTVGPALIANFEPFVSSIFWRFMCVRVGSSVDAIACAKMRTRP